MGDCIAGRQKHMRCEALKPLCPLHFIWLEGRYMGMLVHIHLFIWSMDVTHRSMNIFSIGSVMAAQQVV